MTALKTLLILITVIFAAISHAHAADAPLQPAQQQFTYRNFIWGVGKEDVRQFETAVFYKEEGNSLYFLLRPDQYNRMIRYDFKDDKLVGIRFEVVEFREPISGNVVNMFYDTEQELSELYGPGKAQALWIGKRYQNHPMYWGRALYGRDLRLKTTWTPPGALVEAQAYYDGIVYQLFYTIVKTQDSGPNANAIALPTAAQKPAPATATQP